MITRRQIWAGTAFAAGLGLIGCGESGSSKAEMDAALSTSQALAIKAESLRAQLQLHKLRSENRATDTALATAKQKYRDYRADYRISIRKKMLGKRVARLATDAGVFLDVTVRDVSDKGLQISHAGGEDIVRLDELGTTLSQQLGYEEEDLAELRLNDPAPAPGPAIPVPAKQRELDRLNGWLAEAERKLEVYQSEIRGKTDPRSHRVPYASAKAKGMKRLADDLEERIRKGELRAETLREEIRKGREQPGNP